MKNTLYRFVVAGFCWLVPFLTASADSIEHHSTASYTELNQPQFIAELYAPAGELNVKSLLSGKQPFEMRLTIEAKSIGSRRFRKFWLEGVAINNPPNKLASMNKYLAQFSNLFKGRLTKGDDFRVRYTDNQKTIITLNGITLENYDSPLGPLLLSCWLGEIPLSSTFKDELLASQIESDANERRKSLSYTKDRQQAIEGWIETTPSLEIAGAPKVVAVVAEPVKPKLAATPKPITTPKAEVKPQEQPKPKAPVEVAKKPEPKPVAPAPKVTAKPTPPPAKITPPKQAEPKTEEVSLAVEDEQEEEEELDIIETEEVLALRQAYYQKLVKHLQNFKTIPFTAFQRKWEGEVRLQVVINRQGEVVSHRLIKADRRDVFNTQALDALRRATPFPVIPAELSDSEFSFTVPLQYSLR